MGAVFLFLVKLRGRSSSSATCAITVSAAACALSMLVPNAASRASKAASDTSASNVSLHGLC